MTKPSAFGRGSAPAAQSATSGGSASGRVEPDHPAVRLDEGARDRRSAAPTWRARLSTPSALAAGDDERAAGRQPAERLGDVAEVLGAAARQVTTIAIAASPSAAVATGMAARGEGV